MHNISEKARLFFNRSSIIHLHERPVPLPLGPRIPGRPPRRGRRGRRRRPHAVILLLLPLSPRPHAQLGSEVGVLLLQVEIDALEVVGLAGQLVDVGIADLRKRFFSRSEVKFFFMYVFTFSCLRQFVRSVVASSSPYSPENGIKLKSKCRIRKFLDIPFSYALIFAIASTRSSAFSCAASSARFRSISRPWIRCSLRCSSPRT